MRRWKFLDASGRPTGRRMTCPESMAKANCGAGETAVEIPADEPHEMDPAITAKMRILGVEALTARALREALLEVLPANSPSRKRLEAAESAIVKLRGNLSGS